MGTNEADGKLRLYLTMFLCVLWDLSPVCAVGPVCYPVCLSTSLEDLSVCISGGYLAVCFPEGAVCVPALFKEDLPVCVPEGPVTFLRDKTTSDLDAVVPSDIREQAKTTEDGTQAKRQGKENVSEASERRKE
ncbi:hypothetical protein Bbelb_251700 [Branchiostoma belcheri]|nr:hypothetical protein Bbelb_251700 [Branchiostoma belcheri]